MILGVGCDIVALDRFIKKRDELAKRILTSKEYDVYVTYGEQRQLEYLAGRFAAKEAIVKAVPFSCVLSGIEVLNDGDGKPYCEMEDYQLHISISHEQTMAIAYAICEKR